MRPAAPPALAPQWPRASWAGRGGVRAVSGSRSAGSVRSPRLAVSCSARQRRPSVVPARPLGRPRAGAGPATEREGPPPALTARPPRCATASTWCCPPGPGPPAAVRLLLACSPLPWGGWAPRRAARWAGLPRAAQAGRRRGRGGGASGTGRGLARVSAPGGLLGPASLLLRRALYLSLSLGLPPHSASLLLTSVANSSLPLTLPLRASLSLTSRLSLPLCHCSPAVTLWEVVLSLEVRGSPGLPSDMFAGRAIDLGWRMAGWAGLGLPCGSCVAGSLVRWWLWQG